MAWFAAVNETAVFVPTVVVHPVHWAKVPSENPTETNKKNITARMYNFISEQFSENKFIQTINIFIFLYHFLSNITCNEI
jgi:hypothetical protein